jgi:WhiB family redox-sensing transcriptional regulator
MSVNAATVAWLMAPHAPHEPTTLEELLARPEWQRQAACRGMDSDVFIAAGKGTGESYVTAKAACDRCEVRSECLEFALADPGLLGVWAGTTERERREMRRRVA